MATPDDNALSRAVAVEDSAEAFQSTDSVEQPAKDSPRSLQPPPAIRHWTVEERQLHEKKLLCKIDLHVLPIIITMYILNYIDRYQYTFFIHSFTFPHRPLVNNL